MMKRYFLACIILSLILISPEIVNAATCSNYDECDDCLSEDCVWRWCNSIDNGWCQSSGLWCGWADAGKGCPSYTECRFSGDTCEVTCGYFKEEEKCKDAVLGEEGKKCCWISGKDANGVTIHECVGEYLCDQTICGESYCSSGWDCCIWEGYDGEKQSSCYDSTTQTCEWDGVKDKCIKSDPILGADTPEREIDIDEIEDYYDVDFTLENDDSVGCTRSKFSLSFYDCPYGWTCRFDNALSTREVGPLSPQSTDDFYIRVRPPSGDVSEGEYEVIVKAERGTNEVESKITFDIRDPCSDYHGKPSDCDSLSHCEYCSMDRECKSIENHECDLEECNNNDLSMVCGNNCKWVSECEGNVDSCGCVGGSCVDCDEGEECVDYQCVEEDKECTYKVCDGVKCELETMTVPVDSECPEDGCSEVGKCDEECGAESECHGKDVGDSCGTNKECKSDCKCGDVGAVCDEDGNCENEETVANCPDDCCEDDCTGESDNICHEECDGYNGCKFTSGCDGVVKDEYVCESECSRLDCCEGGEENTDEKCQVCEDGSWEDVTCSLYCEMSGGNAYGCEIGEDGCDEDEICEENCEGVCEKINGACGGPCNVGCDSEDSLECRIDLGGARTDYDLEGCLNNDDVKCFKIYDDAEFEHAVRVILENDDNNGEDCSGNTMTIYETCSEGGILTEEVTEWEGKPDRNRDYITIEIIGDSDNDNCRWTLSAEYVEPPVTTEPPVTGEINVELEFGWNMISHPFEDVIAETNCNEGKILSSIWGDYENKRFGESVDDFEDMRGGYGYIVKIGGECEIAFSGDEEIDEIELGDGWNLIGAKTEWESTSDCENVRESSLWTDYESEDKSFQNLVKSFDNMIPGKAYLVKVGEDCTLE